jgi:hypothetical protein
MSGSTVNASIPLAANVPGNFQQGFGQTIANAGNLLNLQQQQQQAYNQNALRSVLGAPGAIDPTGQPTPETMSKVMRIDPNAGLKLQQNSLVTAQRNLAMNSMRTKAAFDQADYLNNAFAPIVEQYEKDTAPGSTMTKAQADAKAQEAWAKAREGVLQGGVVSPDVGNRVPAQWNYEDAKARAMQTQQYMNWQREERQRQTEANRGEVAGVDADGRPIVIRPNAPPGHQATYLGTDQEVPQEKLTGSHRMGTGAAGGKDAQVKADVLKDVEADPKFANASAGEKELEVVRRIRKAGSPQAGLEGEALDNAARWFNATHELPPGFGGQADREAIMTRAAQLDTEERVTPEQRQMAWTSGKADLNSLKARQNQRDAIVSFEKGAEREFDLAQSLIPKTPEPFNSQLLTRWVRSGERQFGDVPNAQFYTALVSALDEYAKVIGGATGSAAASTDSARAQALSIIPPGATTAQIKGVIDTIKKGMNNRAQGYDDEIADIKGRLLGGGLPNRQPATPASSGQPAQAPGDADVKWLKAHPEAADKFDKHFGAGSASKVLGGQTAAPASAPQAGPRATPAPPAQAAPQADPRAQPSAPTTEGNAAPGVVPGQAYKLPAGRENDPDGTTYNQGKYIKRGNRLYINASAQGGDQGDAIVQAKEAIRQGAPREAVIKRLREGGITPPADL